MERILNAEELFLIYLQFLSLVHSAAHTQPAQCSAGQALCPHELSEPSLGSTQVIQKGKLSLRLVPAKDTWLYGSRQLYISSLLLPFFIMCKSHTVITGQRGLVQLPENSYPKRSFLLTEFDMSR